MGVGHVLGDRRVAADGGAPPMHPDARAPLKHFDGRRRQPNVELLMDERIWDGVAMVRDVDVVIDVHARLAPLGVDEALGRQRPQSGPIETLEEILARQPAVAFHRPGVQIGEELADARVQRRERKEGLMPEPREDPALRHLDADFRLRFITRLGRSRGDDRRAVVCRPLFVGALEDRFVAARVANAGPELIRDNGRGDAANILSLLRGCGSE